MKWRGFIGEEFYIVESRQDLKRLLEDLVDPAIGEPIQELIDDANYNDRKINTDLVSYEMQLYKQSADLRDIAIVAKKALEYVRYAKRLNRNKLEEYLKEILSKGE